MGCTTSKSGVGLDGLSAKKWLKIQGVPASVQVLPRSDGRQGITVVTAGMDNYGLIGILERAFHGRGLGIESGEWAVRSSLFHGTFHLHPLDDNMPGGSQPDSPESGRVISLQAMTVESSTTPAKSYSAARKPMPDQLKVDVHHTMGDELHAGMASIVNGLGGRILRGSLQRGSVSPSEVPPVDRDSFWIDVPDPGAMIKQALASPQDLQERLRAERQAFFEEEERSTILSGNLAPRKVDANTTDSLLNALRIADHKAQEKSMLELPTALLKVVRKTPYEISQSSWGYQIEGFRKYMGAGLNLCKTEDASSEAPVLQFTTFIVQNKQAEEQGPKSRWKLTAFQDRQYGEFTNSIDVNHRRFIVEKVFLNKVCPSGHNIGATASAEQLWAPVWEKGAAGLGEILPVHRIREVKLNDVVNWNTYAVISVALAEKGERSDVFGETFVDSLNEELRSAGLTRDSCKSLPLVDIVKRTQLGKFILRILSLWHNRTSVCLKVTDAEVTFRSEYERIAGEPRAVMDVICKVEVEYGVSLDPSSPNSTPQVPFTPDGAQQNQITSAGKTPGEAALIQWMGKIKESVVDVDHGFSLGNTGFQDLANIPVTGLTALNRAIRELQRERGRSCEAVAGDLIDDADKMDNLTKQRKATDEAFVDLLELTDFSVMRAVSTSLILLRTVVDQNLGSSQTWEDRYRVICTEPRAFNSLIGNLVESLASACKMNRNISDESSESIRLFCYFGEQLGRERAFVLARGSRPPDRDKEVDGMRNLVLMSATRTLIGDLLQLNSRALFRNLDEAESRFMMDEMHDPQGWFQAISPCIDATRDLIDKLIAGETSQVTI